MTFSACAADIGRGHQGVDGRAGGSGADGGGHGGNVGGNQAVPVGRVQDDALAAAASGSRAADGVGGIGEARHAHGAVVQEVVIRGALPVKGKLLRRGVDGRNHSIRRDRRAGGDGDLLVVARGVSQCVPLPFDIKHRPVVAGQRRQLQCIPVAAAAVDVQPARSVEAQVVLDDRQLVGDVAADLQFAAPAEDDVARGRAQRSVTRVGRAAVVQPKFARAGVARALNGQVAAERVILAVDKQRQSARDVHAVVGTGGVVVKHVVADGEAVPPGEAVDVVDVGQEAGAREGTASSGAVGHQAIADCAEPAANIPLIVASLLPSMKNARRRNCW